MNGSNNIVRYKDDLIFAACEFRWSKGDKFALIEAIAICAANDLQYPAWVRSQINVAMTGIFDAVFPDQDLKEDQLGLGISYLPEGHELVEMRKRFQTSANDASRLLSLKLDRRNIIETHIKAIRDFHLAELVERFVEFELQPTARFSGSTKVKEELSIMLNLSKVEWEECENTGGDLGPINGSMIRISSVEPICRMATFDNIDDAWEEYKNFFLNERTVKFDFDPDLDLAD